MDEVLHGIFMSCLGYGLSSSSPLPPPPPSPAECCAVLHTLLLCCSPKLRCDAVKGIFMSFVRVRARCKWSEGV